jgi:hypothetical protein
MVPSSGWTEQQLRDGAIRLAFRKRDRSKISVIANERPEDGMREPEGIEMNSSNSVVKNLTPLVLQWWGDDAEGDEGVFYEESAHQKLVQTDQALWNAKTWEEFERLCPRDVFSELAQWVINGGEQVYWDGSSYQFIDPAELESYLEEAAGDEEYYIKRADDPFESDEIWGAGEGDFPYWLGEMFEGFPEDFLEKYGKPVSSMVSGSWYQFPMKQLEEMRCELGLSGFEVVRVVTEGCGKSLENS